MAAKILPSRKKMFKEQASSTGHFHDSKNSKWMPRIYRAGRRKDNDEKDNDEKNSDRRPARARRSTHSKEKQEQKLKP